MRLCVLGPGNSAIAITENLIGQGFDVLFAVSNPEEPRFEKLAHRLGEHAMVISLEEAVMGADIFFLGCAWESAQEICATINRAQGKILIDATNPIISGLQLDHPGGLSGSEQIAQWAPNLKVFKALNQTGYEVLRDPLFQDGRPVTFVAGDDQPLRPQIIDLIQRMGFDTVDAGPLKNARFLEEIGLFWVYLAHLEDKGHNFAFSLLRR